MCTYPRFISFLQYGNGTSAQFVIVLTLLKETLFDIVDQLKIQEGYGPQRFYISAEQLKDLWRHGFTVTAIAKEGLLGPKAHRYVLV